MRRLILLIIAVAAISPAQAMGQKPKLAVTLTSCSSGATAPQRSLTVSGSMPSTAATHRMWMRFELYAKPPGASTFKRVKLPAWNPWVESEPGVSGLVFQRTVDSLVAPASYKVVVRFRWYNAAGKRAKSKAKTSHTCRQPATATGATPTQ